MGSEALNIIFALFLVSATIALFIWVTFKIRARGGSMMHTVFGATYEMQNTEKRAAIEQIVEQPVKKMEEQETDEPKNKAGNVK